MQLNANSVYPVIHEATLPLIAAWLKHKRQHGNAIERATYQGMGLVSLIQRLLDKRALQFYGADDHYYLLDGNSGSGGWEHVGTEREKEPLVRVARERAFASSRRGGGRPRAGYFEHELF